MILWRLQNYKMASSKRLFTLTNPHGQGGVFFAWQRTSGGFLATTGYDQVIYNSELITNDFALVY